MKNSPAKKSDRQRPPLIFVSPNTEVKGDEFGDMSISLSETYQRAIMVAGGLPLAMPGLVSREMVAECVRRCDGVLFTGGDDVDPEIYSKKVSPELRKTVTLDH